MKNGIEALLEGYPDAVQRLARQARTAIRKWLADASESMDESPRMLSYALGPGYRGMVCTLLLSQTGVKVGIVHGASFPDPHKLMRGVGKVHRHVPLREPEDLKHPGLEQLVRAAAEACRSRLAAHAG